MDNKEFTVEDILAEQRARREAEAAGKAAQAEPAPPREDERAQEELPPAAPEEAQPEEAAAQEDLNAFATGSVELPGAQRPEAPPREERPAKKKKKGRGLFGRRKKVPDFDENEDDMYYGIQLKPIDEYSMGYDSAGELTSEEDAYKTLFDDSKKAIDDEVEQNFQRLQKERRRRVAEAVQSAGVDEQEIADEFGVVAPMPVTSFAADPYARQHGIGVEGGKRLQGEMPEIQKAMLETSSDQTMEIKLNVLNDTVELQRVQEDQPVSEEAVERVLQSPEREEPAREEPQEEPAPEETQEEGVREEETREEAAPEESAPAQPEAAQGEEPTVVLPPVRPQRQQAEPPKVSSIYEYRSRNVPTHIIHAEVLQGALLSESEELRQAQEAPVRGRRRVRNKKLEVSRPPRPSGTPGSPSTTTPGPRTSSPSPTSCGGEMRELTLRMMITRGVHRAAGPGEPDLRRPVRRGWRTPAPCRWCTWC